MYILSDFNFWICGFCRLLVGAPYEMNGPYQTGDVYKCSLSRRTNGNGCSKLNLGIVSQNTTQFLPENHKIHYAQRQWHECTTSGWMCMHVLYRCLYVCVLSACVSVNIMVACARQECGYHTNHSTFYCFFKWFIYISTCVLYRTSRRMLLHTGCTCVVLVREAHEILSSERLNLRM